MRKILPFLILISALGVSGSAAFYSVYGLGKLFAGAALQVMIMAGTLEFSKLIIATALHRYWTEMNKLIRTYLVIATIVLIGITSAGIYGFLSSAYQVTAAKDSITTKKIELLDLKKDRFDQARDEYIVERKDIVSDISELRKSLSSPNQVQYVDRETGQLVTTTSSSARRTLEAQLEDAVDRRDLVSKKIENLTDSVTTMEIAIVNAEASSETSAELGPLKYIAGLTGKSMDVVVNYFLLLLIFVFDPLAVTLIVLANFAFQRAYGSHAIDMVSDKISKRKESSTEEEDEKITIVNDEPTNEDSPDPEPTKRKILKNDMVDDVTERIRNALPWFKDSEPKPRPRLSDAQKKNMTHQEIEQWKRKNLE